MDNVVPLETELERELRTVVALWKLLEPLKAPARARVLTYLAAQAGLVFGGVALVSPPPQAMPPDE